MSEETLRPAIEGIHHVTAIAGDPQRNLDFYAGLLGLRLVKLTVNFDAPDTYHFYFGSDEGAPGTIMTFFPWGRAVHRGTPGAGETSATAFAIPVGSANWWRAHLSARGIAVAESRRFGAAVLSFPDPDGLPLELIESDSTRPVTPWADSSIPDEHAIRGFEAVTLSLASTARTAALLTRVFGFREVGAEEGRQRFVAGGGASGGTIDLITDSTGRHAQLGAGSVHHIALRARDDAEHAHWRTELVRAGFNVTPVLDRSYFHSIYFREPGGVIFEIATDNPGFATDESRATLGTRLMLPPQYEPGRAGIERSLPPITLPQPGSKALR